MRNAKLAAVILAVLLLSNVGQASTLYDATADFSIAANPNGAWAYGYLDSSGTTFTSYTGVNGGPTAAWHGNPGLEGWSQFAYDSSSYSVVGKNPTGTVQRENPAGSIFIDPGWLFAHPGEGGEEATIRFTAPTNGTYDISALFKPADSVSGNRDVHVFINGTDQIPGSLVLGPISSGNTVTDSQTNLLLTAGTTVDFSIGKGTDGHYYNDATMFTATVTLVPEPASSVLLVMGAIGLCLVARRSRNA